MASACFKRDVLASIYQIFIIISGNILDIPRNVFQKLMTFHVTDLEHDCKIDFAGVLGWLSWAEK